jgi:hypothetical protein
MSYPELLSAEEKLADATRRLGIEDVVVLCGSMRFADLMAEVAIEESVRGALVLKPDCNMKHPHPLWADPVEAEALKLRLDDQHRQKIRLAHRVIVVGDYAGDSTRAEIAYARELGKPVRFTHPSLEAALSAVTVGGQPVPIDDVIWLERHPCGCVASAVIAHVPGEWAIATPEQACEHFNRSDREREQAQRAARTFEPVTGATYRTEFSGNWRCTEHAKQTPVTP